jgi:hypothetical protein
MLNPDIPHRRAWSVFLIVSLYLIAVCLYRVFIPANGLPAPNSTYWSVALDLVLVAALLASRRAIVGIPEHDERRKWINKVFGFGLAAGIVIILIRFTGDHTFRSGHLRYQLRL